MYAKGDAMLSCQSPVKPLGLLEALLEDSERIYHRHCAAIQRIFHERWLELVGEVVGREQLNDPDANPTRVEAEARARLQPSRLALRQKQGELLREEQGLRASRDAAIHAYVASLHARVEAAAA